MVSTSHLSRYLAPLLLLAFLAAGSALAGEAGTNTIKGRLARADGTPVRGVKVRVNLLPRDLKDAFTSCGEVVTNEKGGFVFTGLPDGLYCFVTSETCDRHGDPQTLTAPPNAFVEKGQTLDVGVLRYGYVNVTLRGRATHSSIDGKLLVGLPAGTRVYWRQGEGGLAGPALVVGDGFFSLKLMGWHGSLGEEQVLRFVFARGLHVEQRVRVAPGGLVHVSTPHPWTVSTVNGRVDCRGKALAGVTVLVVPDEPGRFVAYHTPVVTGDDGTFALPPLPHGAWRVYAFRSPWEVQGRKVSVGDKGATLNFSFPDRATQGVDFSCKVTIEGVDYGAWLRRIVPFAQALKMQKMVLALVPEGFDLRKDCLPPAAALMPCDAGTYRAKLSGVPAGLYRVFLGLGVKAETDDRLLVERKAAEGSALDTSLLFSPCGWVPMQHPRLGIQGLIDGTVVEVKAGAKISLHRDCKLEEALGAGKQEGARHVLAYLRKVLKELKGGGE